MYPELNNEFSGFGFHGDQQIPYQNDQRYNIPCGEDIPIRHYTQLSNFNNASSTYQLLNSLDSEKKKFNGNMFDITNVFESENDFNTQLYNIPSPESQTSTSDCELNFPQTPVEASSAGLSFPEMPTSLLPNNDLCLDNKEETSTSSSRPRLYKFNPKPLSLNPQMKRSQIPSDDKNGDYWEKRKKNNEASRRSRLARRLKECMVMEEMKHLRKENEELRAELARIQNSSISRL